MLETADTIEIVWSLIALSGLLIQGWAALDAAADLRAVRIRGANDELSSLARSHLRSGVIFCFIHLLFLLAGISAMFRLSTEAPSASRQLTIVALIVAAVVLVLNGLLDRRARLRLRNPSNHLKQREAP